MEGFTPVLSTSGAVLIGFAALELLPFNGRTFRVEHNRYPHPPYRPMARGWVAC